MGAIFLVNNVDASSIHEVCANCEQRKERAML